MRRTFELTPVSARALSRNNWLSVAALKSMKVTTAYLPSRRTMSMNHLRAYTLSLHPRAGLNPAWVSGSRSSSTAISLRATTAESSLYRVAEEEDRTIVHHVVTKALLVQHDECPTREFGRDMLRVPHHAAYAEELICSVHGPCVGFYGHVVTPRRFAAA